MPHQGIHYNDKTKVKGSSDEADRADERTNCIGVDLRVPLPDYREGSRIDCRKLRQPLHLRARTVAVSFRLFWKVPLPFN